MVTATNLVLHRGHRVEKDGRVTPLKKTRSLLSSQEEASEKLANERWPSRIRTEMSDSREGTWNP
jgi:hypothetical protein